MLYLTTRDQKDAHTSHRTLLGDYAADGGIYLPFQLQRYDAQQIRQLKDRTFGDIVSQILNYFFSAQLTSWDVEFAIGRNPIKTTVLGRKIMVSELWHNHENSFASMERNLYRILSKSNDVSVVPTDWAKIAIRIAVLFGVYGDLLNTESISSAHEFDVVSSAEGFFEPISALYAKKMGLPIRKIVVCCSAENGAVWDLIHRNEVSTSVLSVHMKSGVERLLYVTFGSDELARYLEACDNKRNYQISSESEKKLTEEFFCVVVGNDRLTSVISSVASTENYNIDGNTAMSFGAIQDHRAKTGESALTLVLSENKATQ